MRLLITADLHYNQAKSQRLTDELIDRMNAAGGDGVLVVGDTATADGEALERCLERFRVGGPKLFVPGNHELWTAREDSYAIFTQELPQRVRQLGWRWLQSDPLVMQGAAIVGSIGWYDYSFAPAYLGIPRRFYEQKISPGAAGRLEEYGHLLQDRDDIPPAALDVVARWNDGRFVKLHRSDAAFLEELAGQLEEQLRALAGVPTIIAAIHHLPFRELLPPLRSPAWDFAKAYLGSDRLGRILLRYPNVRQVFCGHSHLPDQVQVGHISAINIGSGYRQKRWLTLDLPDVPSLNT